ncbi:MAG: tetratricopeptide repeat protein [Chloroflexi bacterium]|nr:tetratricopeptide repeat protein [Chloroflexota bacterium]
MFVRLQVLIAAAALMVSVILAPEIAAAWFYNLSDIDLAHAAALPADAPLRSSALDDASQKLGQANSYAPLNRAPLAATRIDLARGLAERAASQFDQAASSLRSDPIVLYDWGQAAYGSGQADKAYAYWRAAGAFVYFDQEMHRESDQRQWKEAARLARIAAGVEPNSAQAHYVLGDALAQLNVDDAEALPELDRARELTDDREFLSTIISRRAEILAARGELPAALDTFAQARAEAPIDARPRTGYALVLLQLHPTERDQAVALLTQVTGDSPWYTAAFIGLANISESNDDSAAAERWLLDGLGRNPASPDVLFALGEFYVRQNRLQDARRDLVLALAAETRADRLMAISSALDALDGK